MQNLLELKSVLVRDEDQNLIRLISLVKVMRLVFESTELVVDLSSDSIEAVSQFLRGFDVEKTRLVELLDFLSILGLENVLFERRSFWQINLNKIR